jgi:hypothetical protein
MKATKEFMFFLRKNNKNKLLIINSIEIITLLKATGCKAIKCEKRGNVKAKIKAFILLVCKNAKRIIILIGSAKYKGNEVK